MKKLFSLMIMLIVVFGFSVTSHATLYDRGTDTLGNKLIYDDGLDVTWYDYTNGFTTWDNQVAWGVGLTVDFGGNIYSDWRLPTSVNGKYVYGYDGVEPYTYTDGYNLTNSEMGHLYYTELGNKSYIATDGTSPQPGYGLTNTGDFSNLINSGYWSGTENSANPALAWVFDLRNGSQYGGFDKSNNYYALAVRSGDVAAVVPEPSTYLLLGSGIAGLIVWRRKKKLVA